MAVDKLKLIKRKQEMLPQADVDLIPRGKRGIYVLYHHRRNSPFYNVVYVGMARSGERAGIRGRLRQHRRNKTELWTHCSVFEVWENVSSAEVTELEGLFRHIYATDQQANKLNKQRKYKKISGVPSIIATPM